LVLDVFRKKGLPRWLSPRGTTSVQTLYPETAGEVNAALNRKCPKAPAAAVYLPGPRKAIHNPSPNATTDITPATIHGTRAR
jgi:hypothetical protein